MSVTKGWDWSQNQSKEWLVPANEAAFLAERWTGLAFRDFLDMGCGLGRHAIYMARKGFNVDGVDVSEEAVAHLEQWACRERLKIRVQQANMLCLPFEDSRFDCIMAYNVIYHTDTAGFKAALGELRRVLRPGGELFLTMLSKRTPSFQLAPAHTRLDANSYWRDEGPAERHVPHFCVEAQELAGLFADWRFVQRPMECISHDLQQAGRFSAHFTALVQRPLDNGATP